MIEHSITDGSSSRDHKMRGHGVVSSSWKRVEVELTRVAYEYENVFVWRLHVICCSDMV